MSQKVEQSLFEPTISFVGKLDRLGRDLRHLVNTVHELTARGIGFKVLTGHGASIDTTFPGGKLVFGIFAALAEFERELIIERTKAGMAAARPVAAMVAGRPYKMAPSKLRLAVASMNQPETRIGDLCAELGITLRMRRSDRCAPGRCARRSDQRPEEETSPQLHNSAARHRLREFGRKNLDSRLTTIVVKATLSSCSTSKSSMIRRRRRWPWSPMRSRLLSELAVPASAATLATRVGLARQKVNYHLHALEAHGLVRLAQERKWGGLTERLLVATAASYVVSPSALGPVAVDPNREVDRLSASYLIALGARVVREVGDLVRRAKEAGKRLATLAVDTEVRFRSATDRAAFSNELTEAITKLVSKYHDESAPGGRAHRLVVVAHPLPQKSDPKEPS